jgi:hypothetical protein
MSNSLVLVALSGLPCAAAPTRAAVEWEVRVGLTAAQLKNLNNTLAEKGFRPVWVSGYSAVEANRFAAVWEKRKGLPWELDFGMDRDGLVKRVKDLKGKGYRPLVLSGYDLIGAERYADLWEKGDRPAWEIDYGLSPAGLKRVAVRMEGRGYRPVALSSYLAGGNNTYAVVWAKSDDGWQLRWDLSAAGLKDALRDLSARGYRPVALSGLGAGGVERFSCAWRKVKGPAWEAAYGDDVDAFAARVRSLKERGYHPVSVGGYNTLNGPRYVSLWEKQAGQ